MAVTTATAVPATSFAPPSTILGKWLRTSSGRVGVLLLTIHLLVALTAPWIVPYDYTAQDAALILQPPSTAHPLGTDKLGRDILTRTMLGGRIALAVTMVGVVLAMLWGGSWVSRWVCWAAIWTKLSCA